MENELDEILEALIQKTQVLDERKAHPNTQAHHDNLKQAEAAIRQWHINECLRVIGEDVLLYPAIGEVKAINSEEATQQLLDLFRDMALEVIGSDEIDDRWDGNWRNGYKARGNEAKTRLELKLKELGSK